MEAFGSDASRAQLGCSPPEGQDFLALPPGVAVRSRRGLDELEGFPKDRANESGVDRPRRSLSIRDRVFEGKHQRREETARRHQSRHHGSPFAAPIGIECAEESVVPDEIEARTVVEREEIGDLVADIPGQVGVLALECVARQLGEIDSNDFPVVPSESREVVSRAAARNQSASSGNEISRE